MSQREHPFTPKSIRSETDRLVVKDNILNKRETVQALMDSIQKGDFEGAKSMLAEDFHFSGSLPEPIDAKAWLDMSFRLKAAFPDLDYHFKVIGAQGDAVRSIVQLSGTHSGSLDLTNLNMGTLPATNRAFSAKPEKTKVAVRGDKIASWTVESTEGAGLAAILGQLGLKPASL
jgi:predicted ester cyclase